MQTVVFTLIPWILDQVEDDTQSLSSLRDRRRPGLLLSFLRMRESSVVTDNITLQITSLNAD